MKVLMVGQLPVEAGGNYTTGAAKVVYELTKQHINNVDLYMYATNASEQSVRRYCKYPNKYIGYISSLMPILKDLVLHPLKTLREWRHYFKKDHENPLRYAFYKSNLERAIKIVQPDLIHVHSIGNVSATRFAMGKSEIPLLLTCHGIFYRGEKNDIEGRDRYFSNLPLCNYYTGLTEEASHELTEILKIPSDKFTIIPNGVDTTKFFFSEVWRRKIRAEQNVSDSTYVFITVASLQERKGQLVFIKLLEQLQIDYQYWMIGLGPDKSIIEKYITEHQLRERVKLLGYHESDELYRYYSAADIYAHSSWKEGQALSEIEAYATGLRTMVNKAIVGTLVGNAQDKDQYCIVDFKDIQLDSIKEWIMNMKGNRTSQERFDWKHIAEKYVELYRNLLK